MLVKMSSSSSEEKSREQIIKDNLKRGYKFEFICPGCKDVIPLAMERTSYSGFGMNDYSDILFSCPGCGVGDRCMKCAPELSPNSSMYCVKCGKSRDDEE